MLALKYNISSGLLIISYLDYPSYEGLSRRISGLANVLNSNGINVKIIAPIARNESVLDDDVSSKISVQRVDLRRFQSKNPNNLLSRLVILLFFSLISSFIVVKDVIKYGYLIQYQSIYSAFPALVAKFILGAHIIGDDIVLVNPFLDASISKLTDTIVTPSVRTLSFSNELGLDTLYVPNGVQGTSSENSYSRLTSKLLFVGSLSFSQNFIAVNDILEISSLLDENISFEVLIVGGPLDCVKNLLNHPVVKQGKIKFFGRVSKVRLNHLYSSSYLGLLPFFKDTPLLGGQRIKALEFFANGLLVISGPEGIKGIDGLLPNVHYLLVNSVEEMVDAIKKCLKNPEYFFDLAKSGSNYVLTTYSWESLTNEYVDFIKNLTCGGLSQ